MSAKVVVIDRGWRRIERAARVLARRNVRVGIRAGATSQDGMAVIDYAVINELGSESIPSRPFIRRTADNAQPALSNFARQQVGRMIDGVYSVEQVLDRIGLWYQVRIETNIRSAGSWSPPNSPATIAAKGSSRPLIDHSILVTSIGYEIT